MTIQDILEELYDTGYLANNLNFVAKRNVRIAQAKSKIEEMFLNWLGEDKLTYEHREIKLGGHYVTETDARYNAGYNKRGEEIRNRVKEVR